MNPDKNNEIKLTDRTGVHQFCTLTLTHEKNSTDTFESYLMSVKNIADQSVSSYNTVYGHQQYKDLVRHFPAAHLSLE